EALLDRRMRALRAAHQKVVGLIEDPWLTEGAAGDHDCVAARLTMHSHGIFGGPDVAVADYGNRQRLLHGGDLLPARVAGVHLRSRARMERQRPRASVLAPAGDVDRIAQLFAPTAANLDGDRQRC